MGLLCEQAFLAAETVERVAVTVSIARSVDASKFDRNQ